MICTALFLLKRQYLKEKNEYCNKCKSHEKYQCNNGILLKKDCKICLKKFTRDMFNNDNTEKNIMP